MSENCKVPGCEKQGDREIIGRVTASKDGQKHNLVCTLGPYCPSHTLQALTILQDAEHEQYMPTLHHMLLPILNEGYTLEPETEIVLGIQDTGTTPENCEYIPKSGNCFHKRCPNAATVRPVLIIPISIDGEESEAYLTGNGFCADHIINRLSLHSINQGDLRVAILRLVNAGLDPHLTRLRVETRPIEWVPPECVMITPDIHADRIENERKASNARNN